MNIHSTNRLLPGLIAVMTLGVLGMLVMKSTAAREPYTKEELADQEKALLAAVDHGRDLWHGSNPSMSSNGLACGNCHPDAAASNPQTFPKYQADLGRVIALRDMINWCITCRRVATHGRRRCGHDRHGGLCVLPVSREADLSRARHRTNLARGR